MKHINYLGGLVFATMAMTACVEVPPSVDLGSSEPVNKALLDTFYTSSVEAKEPFVVVLEEFSGVNCNNCPKGHAFGAQSIENNPGRVAVVTIHNNSNLAIPFDGYHDFRTEKGIKISEEIGGARGLPSGSFSRHILDGETVPSVFLNKWADALALKLADESTANMSLTVSFDASTREMIAKVRAHFTEDINQIVHLSMMVSESYIKSKQKLPDGTKDSSYIHDHVLRGMPTSALGDRLATSAVAGDTYEKEYSFIIPEEWVPENCYVVAFVHKIGEEKDILQGVEVLLAE